MTPAELLKRYELKPGKQDVELRHDRQLWQARFSPTGQFLIASGYDATIQRWDLTGAEPQLLPPLLGHNGWVQELEFLPEEHILSADSWGRLTCWPYAVENPEPIWNLAEAHEGWIRALAVSPDGKVAATGGNSAAVKLWSTANGKLLQELPHSRRVYSLCFHPDGQSLASGDLEGVIRQWNLAAGQELRQLDASPLYVDEAKSMDRIQQCGGVRRLRFDQTGKRLVCAGQKTPGGGFATGTPCAIVFDWESGKTLREMPMGGTSDGFTYDVQFHPDGFVMATSSAFPNTGHVWFWRPEDDQAFFSSKQLANGRSLSLHPDGKRVAHLTSQSPNGNGRALQEGKYPGGSAVIRLMTFPLGEPV